MGNELREKAEMFRTEMADTMMRVWDAIEHHTHDVRFDDDHEIASNRMHISGIQQVPRAAGALQVAFPAGVAQCSGRPQQSSSVSMGPQRIPSSPKMLRRPRSPVAAPQLSTKVLNSPPVITR